MYEPIVDTDTLPWYRQAWPWALIALPASAVIAGVITLVLAIQSPNALVVDDYYKQGLAINQQKQRIAAADGMGLTGLLRYDGQRMQVELNKAVVPAGQVLQLQVIHATRAELDHTLTLQPRGKHFEAALPGLINGSWYLRLRPQDQTWEIRNRMVSDGPFQTLLDGQD